MDSYQKGNTNPNKYDEPIQYYYRIINNKLEITQFYLNPPKSTKSVFSSILDIKPLSKKNP